MCRCDLHKRTYFVYAVLMLCLYKSRAAKNFVKKNCKKKFLVVEHLSVGSVYSEPRTGAN
jgi:hypothetical protein